MLKCYRTDLEGIGPAIKIAFADDEKGLRLYKDPVNSIEIKTVQDAIYEQMYKLKQFADYNIDLLHYRVFSGEALIGFFSCFYDFNNCMFCLVSFGIAVKYRTRLYLNSFFITMAAAMGKNFYTAMWKVNDRANRWLLSNGMFFLKESEYNGHKQSILIYK